MKLLPLIFGICLSASSVSWAVDQQNRFLEIPREADGEIFDLDTVKFILPGKFTIISTTLDNPDVLEFELDVLRSLLQYCARPVGKYPAPTDLLRLGPPDLPVEQIEVFYSSTDDGEKTAHWKYPYQRLSDLGWQNLACERPGRTQTDLFQERYNLIENGYRHKELFDCRRSRHGLFFSENDDPSEAITSPAHPDWKGNEAFNIVCKAVTHEEPYLPKHE